MNKAQLLSVCEGSHTMKITGFCNKCEVSTCDACVSVKHFDHHEALSPYDLQLSQTTNEFVKIKGFVSKTIKKHEASVSTLDIEGVKSEVEERIRGKYKEFRDTLKNHLTNYLREIRNGRYVEKLRNQKVSLTTTRMELLKTMHKEMKGDLTSLMDAVCACEYVSQLPRLEAIEHRRAKLNSLEKAQSCELRNFEEGVRELNSAKVEKRLASSFFQVENLETIDASVYKISRDTSSLIKYSVSFDKLSSVTFATYTPPYNSSIIDLNGTNYVFGGCLAEGTSSEEQDYLDDITELNPYIRKTEKKGAMKTKRMCFGAAGTASGLIFLVGGYNHTGLLSDCEKYSADEQQGTEIAKLLEKKSNCGVCILAEKFLYCFGGYSAGEGDCYAVDVLDISGTTEWTNVIRRRTVEWQGAQNPGVISVSEQEILVFGGKSKGESVNDSLLFTAGEKKFEVTGPMQDSDTFLACRAVIYGDKVYTFGCHENHLHIYDKKTKSWEIKANLLTVASPTKLSAKKSSLQVHH